jgi:hypothetical protein
MVDEKPKILVLANNIADRVKTELEEAATGGKKRKFADSL